MEGLSPTRLDYGRKKPYRFRFSVDAFPLALLPYAPASPKAKSERVNLASDGAWEKGQNATAGI